MGQSQSQSQGRDQEPCQFSCGGFRLTDDGSVCSRNCLPSRQASQSQCGDAFQEVSGFSESAPLSFLPSYLYINWFTIRLAA